MFRVIDQVEHRRTHLVHASSIRLGELALALESTDRRGKLAHGVQVGGELGNHFSHVAGNRGASGPLPDTTGRSGLMEKQAKEELTSTRP